jgi:hypothetical protein
MINKHALTLQEDLFKLKKGTKVYPQAYFKMTTSTSGFNYLDEYGNDLARTVKEHEEFDEISQKYFGVSTETFFDIGFTNVNG